MIPNLKDIRYTFTAIAFFIVSYIKKSWKKFLIELVGSTVLAILIVSLAFIVINCTSSILGNNSSKSDEYKEAYKAWVKRDGNAENLSYNEWRLLINIDPRLILKENKE